MIIISHDTIYADSDSVQSIDSEVQSPFAETRFAESRFAETPTLTLTLNPNPNPKP